MTKIKVGILYGGQSTEHEISMRSARSIVEAMDKDKYDISYIYIQKDGQWRLSNDQQSVVVLDSTNSHPVNVVPSKQLEINQASQQFDVVFPILHGTLGEDGTVQGLLKLANIPYVGCNIRSSSVCMDKDMTKRLLKLEGIHVAKSVVFQSYEIDDVNFNDVKEKLGLPMFIKPVNQGSSVGVSRVTDEAEFYNALNLAFQFDTKVMIEEAIVGREIEVAVLGNTHPIASVPGEIKSHSEFYSYESKYIDENGAALSIPAPLSDNEVDKIQSLALTVFQKLDCEGLARVDVFYTDNGDVYVNEVNTLPGFTSISMYPKLFEESGIPYRELIDRLIHLAIERHKRESQLKTDFS